MSYNITSVSIKKLELFISEEVLKNFIMDVSFSSNGGKYEIDKYRSNELSFSVDGETHFEFSKVGNKYQLVHFQFSSAFDPDDLLDQLHELIKNNGGKLDALYVWEGGETVYRVTIENGVITSKELT